MESSYSKVFRFQGGKPGFGGKITGEDRRECTDE
jgi:hypothetical protein